MRVADNANDHQSLDKGARRRGSYVRLLYLEGFKDGSDAFEPLATVKVPFLGM